MVAEGRRGWRGGDGMKCYVYGMRARGFAPMCQPMEGLVEAVEDTSGSFSEVLIYGRELSEFEVSCYELVYLGEVRRR